MGGGKKAIQQISRNLAAMNKGAQREGLLKAKHSVSKMLLQIWAVKLRVYIEIIEASAFLRVILPMPQMTVAEATQ